MNNIQHNFSRISKAGIRNIIGVIDGTYIPIPATKGSPMLIELKNVFMPSFCKLMIS